MTTELKPCPFCGGEAHVSQALIVDMNIVTYSVICDACGMGIFKARLTPDEWVALKDPQAAIDAWNTRESQPCYADEADHSRCKYSVNRGWVERTCKQRRLFNLVSRECDGEYYQWHDEEMPNFCPNCGAKVVDA